MTELDQMRVDIYRKWGLSELEIEQTMMWRALEKDYTDPNDRLPEWAKQHIGKING